MTSITPLQAIEQAVLDRAKHIDLDLSAAGAQEQLTAIVRDEVAQWSAEFRRGLRSADIADPELIVERCCRNLVGYGPLQPLLDDDDVWEIMITSRGSAGPRESPGQRTFNTV